MRYFAIIFALLIFSACNSSQKQRIPKEEIDYAIEGENGIILLGKISRQGLKAVNFRDWFVPQYDAYQPNAEVLAELKPLMKDVKITVFMGTWCEDSHRDVPDFFKILDDLKFNESNVTMYAVSDDKSEPADLVKEYDIIQVPTFIFYRDGKEVGRIVEYSIRTIEQDMLDILSGKNYKHPYSDF